MVLIWIDCCPHQKYNQQLLNHCLISKQMDRFEQLLDFNFSTSIFPISSQGLFWSCSLTFSASLIHAKHSVDGSFDLNCRFDVVTWAWTDCLVAWVVVGMRYLGDGASDQCSTPCSKNYLCSNETVHRFVHRTTFQLALANIFHLNSQPKIFFPLVFNGKRYSLWLPTLLRGKKYRIQLLLSLLHAFTPSTPNAALFLQVQVLVNLKWMEQKWFPILTREPESIHFSGKLVEWIQRRMFLFNACMAVKPAVKVLDWQEEGSFDWQLIQFSPLPPN